MAHNDQRGSSTDQLAPPLTTSRIGSLPPRACQSTNRSARQVRQSLKRGRLNCVTRLRKRLEYRNDTLKQLQVRLHSVQRVIEARLITTVTRPSSPLAHAVALRSTALTLPSS
ncbi:MAG: hypothetical protein WBF87_17980 [Mesorhizobium sp.]